MDRAIKLAAKLPDGDANGLLSPEVIADLRNDPTRMRVGIVLINVPKWTDDLEADTETGQARIRRLELVLDDTYGDASALQRLLTRAYERRTGSTTLDAGLEADVRAAFDQLDLSQVRDEEQSGGE